MRICSVHDHVICGQTILCLYRQVMRLCVGELKCPKPVIRGLASPSLKDICVVLAVYTGILERRPQLCGVGDIKGLCVCNAIE